MVGKWMTTKIAREAECTGLDSPEAAAEKKESTSENICIDAHFSFLQPLQISANPLSASVSHQTPPLNSASMTGRG
jgi:hypothetical protein